VTDIFDGFEESDTYKEATARSVAAYTKIKRTGDEWLELGRSRAIVEAQHEEFHLRKSNDGSEGVKQRVGEMNTEWCRRNGLSTIQPAAWTALKDILEHEAEFVEWRASKSEHERQRKNYPATMLTAFLVETGRKPKKDPTLSKDKERIVELEEELDVAHAENATLNDRIDTLEEAREHPAPVGASDQQWDGQQRLNEANEKITSLETHAEVADKSRERAEREKATEQQLRQKSEEQVAKTKRAELGINGLLLNVYKARNPNQPTPVVMEAFEAFELPDVVSANRRLMGALIPELDVVEEPVVAEVEEPEPEPEPIEEPAEPVAAAPEPPEVVVNGDHVTVPAYGISIRTPDADIIAERVRQKIGTIQHDGSTRASGNTGILIQRTAREYRAEHPVEEPVKRRVGRRPDAEVFASMREMGETYRVNERGHGYAICGGCDQGVKITAHYWTRHRHSDDGAEIECDISGQRFVPPVIITSPPPKPEEAAVPEPKEEEVVVRAEENAVSPASEEAITDAPEDVAAAETVIMPPPAPEPQPFVVARVEDTAQSPAPAEDTAARAEEQERADAPNEEDAAA
jgi:hypothetical protein